MDMAPYPWGNTPLIGNLLSLSPLVHVPLDVTSANESLHFLTAVRDAACGLTIP